MAVKHYQIAVVRAARWLDLLLAVRSAEIGCCLRVTLCLKSLCLAYAQRKKCFVLFFPLINKLVGVAAQSWFLCIIKSYRAVKMLVVVKTLAGKIHEFNFDSADTSVFDVKRRIQDREGVSVCPCSQRYVIARVITRRRNARLCLLYKINWKITPMATPPHLVRKTTQRRNDNGRSYRHFACNSDP